MNAARSIFTANGLYCPIQAIDVEGETYILNREVVQSTNNGHNPQ